MKLQLVSVRGTTLYRSCAAAVVALCMAMPATAQPVALKEDISVKKVIKTEGAAVLLARDPHTGGLYYANGEGDIYRVESPGGEAVSVASIPQPITE